MKLVYRPVGQDGSLMTTTVTRNIGAGGAFIVTDDPLPVGTELELTVRVPTSDEPIELTAKVRWLVPPLENPEAAGMGVQFTTATVDALLALEDYFASLTAGEP